MKSLFLSLWRPATMTISNLRRIGNHLVFHKKAALETSTIYIPLYSLNIKIYNTSVILENNLHTWALRVSNDAERNELVHTLNTLISDPIVSQKPAKQRWDMPSPDLLTELQ